MVDSCPYCNSVRSILIGNVYCSRHSKPMTALETGTLFIRAKKMEETAEHISRLSIRCVLKGEQYYKVGSHDHLIHPKNYLVVNQGQSYKTAFEGKEEQEMILVAFKPGFAESILHAMVNDDDQLLDDPFGISTQPVIFFEKTYDADPVFSQLFSHLRKLMDAPLDVKQETDLESVYTKMLERLLIVHRDIKKATLSLDCIKASTRNELYRRLSLARDHMDAHTDKKLSINDTARAAGLSPHHFKRSFAQLFGVSPHQYHVQKRLEKATELLNKKLLRVDEVCKSTGFESPSSFIRLFKSKYGTTPGKFK